MVMTFSDWDTYKTKILFDKWDCTKKWQFGLSALCIVVSVVVYKWLGLYLIRLEKKMKNSIDDSANDYADTIQSGLYIGNRSDVGARNSNSKAVVGNIDLTLRIWHGFVSAINYGFALMLMLVAMTFNPVLFVSLMIGYGIGDFIFYPYITAERK